MTAVSAPSDPTLRSEDSTPRPSPILALRQQNYRRFWTGLLGFSTALEMQRFMLPWLAYDLSGSKALLGLMGLAVGLPNLILAPIGGVVADRVGKTAVIRTTQAFASVLALALAGLLLSGGTLIWHILIFALLTGSFSAFDQPARQAIVPHLVPRTALPSAIALSSTAWSLARITGPAIGGVLLAFFLGLGIGPGGVLLVVAGGFLFMVLSISRIQLPPSDAGVGGPRRSVAMELTDGVRYIVENPAVRVIILIVFANNLFGSSFLVLMPVFAREVYAVDERILGLLVSSYGVGALVGIVALTALGGARRAGLLLLVASSTLGIALLLFGFSPSPLVSVPLLVLAGAAYAWSTASANTLVQLTVPDHLRGRVLGIYSLSHNFVSMGAALGGVVAELLGAPAAVILGGALVLAITLGFGATTPKLRTLT